MNLPTRQPPLGDLVGPADQVYTSFEEMPVDELPQDYQDGDDSVIGQMAGGAGFAPWAPIRLSKPISTTRKIVVPHPRDLKLGRRGADVKALQRALAGAKVRKWGGFTNLFGPGTKRCLKKFQARHGLKADGVYGIRSHRKLAPYYDAYGIKLIHRYIKQHSNINTTHQQRLLAAAHVAYNYGSRIHYTQSWYRMMLIRNHIHHEQIPQHSYLYADCSAFATWLYWDAFVPDPNHFGYNGWGFTGTLGMHGTSIPASQAKVGDLYFYGWAPYTHVTINVGINRCISQGSEYGPLLLSPYYRSVSACHHYPGF